LATDFNPGSCPTQDLSFIGLLARLEMKMSLAEVFCAYTQGGAFALGVQNQVGTLQKGWDADFIEIDDDWDQFFYRIGHHPVARVWKKGRILSSKLKNSRKS